MRRNNAVQTLVFSGCAVVEAGEAGHGASDVRRRALAAPWGRQASLHAVHRLQSTIARPRAAPRRNFQFTWWNHGKNRVLPVAVAWKVVLRNRAATRKRLHMVWRRKESGMMALFAPMPRWPILPPRLALKKMGEGIRGERFLNFGQLWRPREPKELIELSILAGFQSSRTFRSIRMILFHDQNVSVRG